MKRNDSTVIYTTDIPAGLCQCGCGGSTSIAKGTDLRRGVRKGQPQRFIVNHFKKTTRDPNKTPYGKQSAGGRRVHQIRAERALGRPLPRGVQVHHADGSTADHAPLVLCQDQAYHSLLHTRTRVLNAGGNPDTDRICTRCKKPRPRKEFTSHRCYGCSRAYSAEVTQKKRMARSGTNGRA